MTPSGTLLSLSENFLKEALGVFAPMSMLAVSFNSRAGRAMTGGEIAMAKGVFGDAVDYRSVRIHATRFMGVAAATAMRNHIFFDTKQVPHTDDLSRRSDDIEADILAGQVMIHELTHIWQKKGLRWLASSFAAAASHFTGRDAYGYDIEDETDFLDYGIEQQTGIVQHAYASREFILRRGDKTVSVHGADVDTAEFLAARRRKTQPYLPNL